jgi:hypothetical protein
MATLMSTVSEICKVKGLTGKIMQDETDSVYIFDCMNWTEECAYMLRFLLPNALLSVENSVSSLSGFVLIVRHEYTPQKASSSRRRMLAAILITCLVYFLLALLHAYYTLEYCSESSSFFLQAMLKNFI